MMMMIRLVDHELTAFSLVQFDNLQVFSDEFNEEGRTFNDGKDPRWTAINKNDCTCLEICGSMLHHKL